MCVILLLYSLPILEAPRPEREPKQTVVKKIKLLYSSVIRGYNRRLANKYKGSRISHGSPPGPHIFVDNR
jgi:hypothetical protein